MPSRPGEAFTTSKKGPRLEGIEAATGVDVAGAIIELLQSHAAEFPAEARPRRNMLRKVLNDNFR
jgi:ribosomal protein S6--L-glutamate ligase